MHKDPPPPTDIAVLVTHKFNPPTNGGEKVCYHFCLALSKRMRLTCASTKQNQTDVNFEISGLFGNTISKFVSLTSFFKLLSLFRRRRIEVCITNQPFYGFAAYLACKISGSKLIIYSHNLEYKRFRQSSVFLGAILFVLELIVYRLCHGVFFVSNNEKQEAIQRFHLNQDRCYFVPPIVLSNVVRQPPLTTRDDVFSIIFFGNFSYQPNLDALNSLLYKICPLLSRELDFAYHISIFGSGLAQQITTTEHVNGSLGTIEILGYLDDHYPQIQSADVMVSPVCEGAGSSIKIIESLSAGTTVISARSGADGICIESCGSKLLLVDDRDWGQYVSQIKVVRNKNLHLDPTPDEFYNVYSEDGVINTVLAAINTI